MPRIHGNRRARSAAAALLILLAASGLAACGGSSKSSSTTTSASATTTKGKRGGQFAARAAALRTCLQKEGITLPKRPSGQGAPGSRPYGGPGRGGAPRGPLGLGTGGGGQLPKGVTRAQFEAALKKCGGGAFGRNGRGFNSAQARQRFTKFAACMRSNGVKLPTPNTSGNGPIFDTKGINTNSAAFKAADAKCAKELGDRRGGTATPNGAPPDNEGGPGPGAPGAAPEGAAPEGPPAG